MKHIIKAPLIILFTAALAFSTTSCSKNSNTNISDTKFLLNTTCTISIYDKQDKTILEQAFQVISHYDQIFSTTIKGSDVYNINRSGGNPVNVDNATIDVIKESIGYSKESDGLFDITVGALTTLWNIEGDNPKVPAEDKIQAAIKTINYKDILIEGNTVTLKNKDAMIDLGGVAKGYIADQIKDFLVSKGVQKAIINLGGNVVVIGSKAKNSPWVVGVQQPFMGKNEDVGYLYVSDKSVVTSGIYERYFMQDGKLYPHILDPRTGYPVDNNLSSVTIVSNQSKEGDGLSATCFLLGVDKAEKLIESLKDVEAIFITKDGKVITTPGINKKVKFVPSAQVPSKDSTDSTASESSLK
jgi:thiamine biosynthesis lipoprotein